MTPLIETQEEEQNVQENEAGLQVAVWIFGGGFIFGSEQIPVVYHPRTFTDRGVIFVSITYRLGALGKQLSKLKCN